MSRAAPARQHRAEGAASSTRSFLRAASPRQPIEPLVRRTLAREPGAWEELWLVLDPTIEELAGRWRVTGRLAASADDRREVVLRVMASLHADGFRRLGKLHAALCRGEDAGRAWIAVMIRREALDHVREHAEYLAGGAGDDAKNSFGGIGPGHRLIGDEVARSAGTRPGWAGDQERST